MCDTCIGDFIVRNFDRSYEEPLSFIGRSLFVLPLYVFFYCTSKHTALSRHTSLLPSLLQLPLIRRISLSIFLARTERRRSSRYIEVLTVPAKVLPSKSSITST